MTIPDETTKELLEKTTIKVMFRQTHALIDNMRKKLANIVASIKTIHTASPERTKFVYAEAIMMDEEYWKRVTILESAWMFTNPTKMATYDSRIKP